MLIVLGRILLYESKAQIPFPPSVNKKSHLPWQNPQGFGREGWADLAPQLEGAGRYRYFYIITIIIIIHPMGIFLLAKEEFGCLCPKLRSTSVSLTFP